MSRWPARTALERFWSKTEPADDGTGCILWTGTKTRRGGYGSFGSEGPEFKTVRAHRWIYAKTHGVTLERQDLILHSCDRPACVNVEHLRVGTAKENTADMFARGRAGNTGNPGERNGFSKLTNAAVASMRARYAAGGVTYDELAQEFGVTRGAVCHAITRRTWKHVA